ncbi:MAG: endo-1,4-beta-xylanase [Treponema sp.]|nr:endo-1,4-beta-xylanase [Treponema sp.]
MHNCDHYSRDDPGSGLQRISAHEFSIKKEFSSWKSWRTNDGRILPNSKSVFSLIDNPFGTGELILLSTYFDPDISGRSFGGFGIRAPVNPALDVNYHTFVEFDLYYSMSASDKYMKFEIWSTSTGGAGSQDNSGSQGTNRTPVFIRSSDLEGANLFNINHRCGYYNDETWFKKSFSAAIPVPDAKWEYLNIDLHTETDAFVNGGLLMIGNIRITKLDPCGVPIPDVINTEKYNEVEPIRKKYNKDNGYFLIGTEGTENFSSGSLGGYHYELFVSHRNLKPERHLRAPLWLKNKYPGFSFFPETDGPEWELPTKYYLDIRNAGCYKLHGHCLAWINQAPPWMCQIIPENIKYRQWNSSGLFYTIGYNSNEPFLKVDRETARRIYFNHIMYEMRHFMTTDTRYDSSEERGIIPFHSFDVVNADVHESRHSFLIYKNEDEWKTSLKHVSWLMAMTDNDFSDIRQHYIYLLFKFAHIAVPNAQMAEKYKESSSLIPEYMKLDNHDNNGSIDAFICEKPPVLIYNDYEITSQSKARIIYNMIKEINAAWKTDPFYDGRNLIECMGIQGHDTVSPALASQNMQAVSLFSGLIDEGLLDTICFSEIDLRQPDTAPGGRALAPDIMNQKQADSIGYQYALLFKLFEKYKNYIDHVIIWNPFGSGWGNSYVLFDHEKMASRAYYAVMDPDKFIRGHSYLDSYFDGEYEKITSAT